MTRFQKVFCVILSLCFFAVLAMAPEWLFLGGNIYRQLPLYRFLEEKARSMSQREDPETYQLLVENNTRYLEEMMEAENQAPAAEKAEQSGNGEDRQLENPETVPGIPEEKEEENQTGAGAQEADSEKNTENSAQKDKAGEESGERESETRTEETKQPSPSASDKEIKEKNEQSLSETEDTSAAQAASAAALPHPEIDLAPETLADYNYLLNNFFIVDPKTATSEQQLNAASFLGKDLTLEKNADAPQILIYHSHSQETFVDSREGRVEDTIVGVGDYLTQLLTETYGYQVIHVTETFDIVDGQIDRSAAYDYARPYIEQVLEENPSIEVVIDLHRDGVPEDRHLVTEINGKPTAQIMFYNGLSYTADGGQVDYLPNPYIQDNLAFSFQLEYQAAQYYPELYRGIYLAALRYNLHLRPRALLLEAGAQTNTVEEVKNAMEPFADILNRVLTGA